MLSLAWSSPLTTGADNIQGTGTNDIITGELANNGASDTFQTWDTIDGGAGTNTLNVEVLAGNYSPTLSNIQVMNVQQAASAAAVATFGMGGLYSLQTLSLNGPANFTINNLGSLPNIGITGTTLGNTLQFNAAALAPTGQTLNLTLNDVTGAAGITLLDIGTNALETVAITATGADSNVGALTFGAAGAPIGTTKLTIAGEAGLTLNVVDDSAVMRTIDGSVATGNLNLTALASSTVTTGSGNDIVTSGGGIDNFNGGDGNDRFVFGAGDLTNLDTVTGGQGNDAVWTTVADANVYSAAPVTPKTITGVETLSMTDAGIAALALVAQNVSTDITTVELQAGINAAGATITLGAGTASTVNIGRSAASAVQTLLGALTVNDTGTATTDSVTIANTSFDSTPGVGSSLDAFGTQAIAVNGYETVNLVTGTTPGVVMNTTGAITLAGDAGASTTLKISGNQSLTTGVITATTIDASALVGATSAAAGIQGLVMGAAAALGLTSITGSAYADTLVGDASSSIAGGAGNVNITGGANNDTLLGEAGNDTIAGIGGNDSIDGGAGNDQVTEVGANITVSDTIKGGEGTDILSINTLNAAISATNLSGISEFEVLDVTAGATVTQVMSDFVNNTGFTEIRANAGANTLAFTNVGSTTNTLALTGGTGTVSFDRLVDVSTNALTVNTRIAAGAALVLTGLTADDEETITFNTSRTLADGTTQANNTTITTLTANDIKTLDVNGGGNFVTTLGATSTALATIDASGATGTVNINAGTSLADMTVTSGIGATTIVAGAGDDSITGSDVADNLTGGAGADTLTGNGGDDILVGGLGADSIDGGAGTNTYSGAGIATTVDLDGGATAMTGQVINLGATTLSAAAINTATGTNISSSLTGVTSGQTAYLGAAATVSSRVDSLSSIQNVVGTDGADYIVGSAAVNNIQGGAGGDTITGGAGADIINAGAGANSVTDAGAGSDVITHNTAGGATVAVAVTGTDTVTITASQAGVTANSRAAVNTSVDASTSSAAVALNGNTGADTLVGGTVADAITGGAGSDRLTGNGGNDTFIYTTSATSVGASGVNTDIITDFTSAADSIVLTAGAGTLLAGVTLTAGLSTTAALAVNVVDATSVATLADVYTAIAANAAFNVAGNFAASVAAAGANQIVAKSISFANGAAAGTYFVVNDNTAAFQAASDLVIGLGTGVVTIANTDLVVA